MITTTTEAGGEGGGLNHIAVTDLAIDFAFERWAAGGLGLGVEATTAQGCSVDSSLVGHVDWGWRVQPHHRSEQRRNAVYRRSDENTAIFCVPSGGEVYSECRNLGPVLLSC